MCVGDPLRADFVGDVHELDLRHQVDELHGQLRRRADEPGGNAQLARIGPRVGDEFLHRLERHRRVHGHDVGHPADAGYGRDIAQLVVGHLREERHGDAARGDVALDQGMPVGRGLGDERGAHHAGDADAVLDDDLLPPQPRQALGDQPRHDVGRAPGAERHDVTDRLAREGLRPRHSRAGRERGYENQDLTCCACSVHHSALLTLHPGRPLTRHQEFLKPSRRPTRATGGRIPGNRGPCSAPRRATEERYSPP